MNNLESINSLKFELPARDSSIIRGELFVSDDIDDAPLVVFCHGFKGFKDWGGWPYMAKKIATEGFATITFNFSHNGVGQDLFDFTELDKFKKNSYSLEEEDLARVLDAIQSKKLPKADKLNTDSVCVVGHSRGGAATLCVGSRRDDVKALVALASIARYSEVSPENEAAWRKKGSHYIYNHRTKQNMPLGLDLLEDCVSGGKKIEEAVCGLDKPLLIVHGDKDEAVPVSDAHKLSKWASNAKLEILEGASHTFGIKHPFEGSSPDFDRVIELLLCFVREETV